MIQQSRWLRFARPRHAVADPAYGEDIGGVVRVIADLAAEPLHVGANQLRVASFSAAPHLSQQRIVGDDPSRVDRKGFEQIEFSSRQLQRTPGNRHPASLIVDRQVP